MFSLSWLQTTTLALSVPFFVHVEILRFVEMTQAHMNCCLNRLGSPLSGRKASRFKKLEQSGAILLYILKQIFHKQHELQILVSKCLDICNNWPLFGP